MRGRISELLRDVEIPKMFCVRQKFECSRIEIDTIPATIVALLSEEKFSNQIKKDMKIAITAGSRGVANLAVIIRAIAEFVRKKGAFPFIVPAMGSHGSSLAEGQQKILESYGVTKEFCGCPIISSMEVVKIGVNEEGLDVWIDKHAAQADGIIVFNRIKPHTSFCGPYESGIMKMMAIGLGKRKGAETCHAQGFENMAKNVYLFGKAIIEQSNILFAVAALENAFDETCKIVALNSDEIEKKEPQLLKEAYGFMPRIYLDECDVLIVDEIGKNYSGSGMDPNITGTFDTPYANGGIKSQRVAVLALSDETKGNGIGIGMCDVIPQKVFYDLDLEAMYLNAITTTALVSSKIPCIVENEKEAIQMCIKTCVGIDTKNIKIVRIANTLHLEHIMLSEAYYSISKSHPKLEIENEPAILQFDEKGGFIN